MASFLQYRRSTSVENKTSCSMGTSDTLDAGGRSLGSDVFVLHDDPIFFLRVLAFLPLFFVEQSAKILKKKPLLT